ncbi:MAG: MFS transporter [Anaerolineae bacterium CG_4_9_14_3_um_filter_57_17]|nr:MFS transporter [bacterium]NCT21738.1 MFS transporter [bacterium]OIO86432.1 MAG: MFS transporter [Anaerolineae bacterium CG2_30_57_67]PJB68389.1 MAG: MFS transporter [Anaerolineae bacterium CG_4_9_14_3_um_filter_57_17]
MNLSATSPQEFQTNWKPRFFTIFTGQALSLFGSSLVQFALVWYLTQKTGSATILATASLVAMLPQVLLGPFAGALVDRWNRRLVMILADGLIALATLVLAGLFWMGTAQIWHIYAILLVRSLGGAFHWPAMSASTSLMVPKEQLSRVAGINQTLQGLVGIVAPPTGALLIGILPTQGVLLIDVFTALCAILPLLFISIPQPKTIVGATTSYWQDVRAGLAYVAAWPGLLAILVIALLINFLLTPTGSLMPLLITKHFGLGALELGFTDTLWGVGMIAGGLLLSVWGGFKRRIVTSLLGIVGIGVSVVLVGLAPANMFWLALVGMSISGLAQVLANGPLQAVIQSAVEPDMQGRVMALIGSGATAMTPLSLAVAGPVSDAIGIRAWYIFGGAACLLMGIVAFSVPAVMNVETNRVDALQSVPPAPVTTSID